MQPEHGAVLVGLRVCHLELSQSVAGKPPGKSEPAGTGTSMPQSLEVWGEKAEMYSQGNRA
jgi:hypothetical protein